MLFPQFVVFQTSICARQTINYRLISMHHHEYYSLVLEGAPLIAVHKSRYYKKKDGLHIGPGMYQTGFFF